MMRHSERALGVLVGCAVATSVLAVGLTVASRIARRKVSDQLASMSRRVGVPIEIGQWHLGLGRVHFEDIVVGARAEIVASRASAEAVLNPFSKRFGQLEMLTVERLRVKSALDEAGDRMRDLALTSQSGDENSLDAHLERGLNAIDKLFRSLPVERLWIKGSSVALLDAAGEPVVAMRGLRLLLDRRDSKILFKIDKLATRDTLTDRHLQGRVHFDDAHQMVRFFVRKKKESDASINEWSVTGRMARDFSTADLSLSMRRLPSSLARWARPYIGEKPKFVVDGQLSAKRQDGHTRFKLQLASLGSRVTVPLISSQPVGPVYFDLTAEGEVREGEQIVTLEKAQVVVPPRRDVKDRQNPIRIVATGSGRLRGGMEARDQGEDWFSRVSWQGQVRLMDAPCQALVDAAPIGLVPTLTDFKLAGDAGIGVKLSYDGAKTEKVDFHIADARYGCTVHEAPFQFSAQHLTGPFTLKRESGDAQHPIELSLGPLAPDFTPLDHVAKSVNQAFVASEDASFFIHKGIDASALEYAARRNFAEKRVAVGGSTITMQTVKNLFLSHERTISRKMQELFLAWHLEKILAKDKILELYLNIVEFGPGIYGIAHAAEHFFAKAPHELSLAESAYLAALLPSPKQRYRYFCDGQLTPAFRDIVGGLLRRMLNLGRIPYDRYVKAAALNFKFNDDSRLSSRACGRQLVEDTDAGS